MARFLYAFGIIFFFSLTYSIYTNTFVVATNATVANINTTIATEYLGKTYNQTVDPTSFFAPFRLALDIISDMFRAMFLPAQIIAEIGVPGSDAIGLIINAVFWLIMAGAIIEIVTKVRGL